MTSDDDLSAFLAGEEERLGIRTPRTGGDGLSAVVFVGSCMLAALVVAALGLLAWSRVTAPSDPYGAPASLPGRSSLISVDSPAPSPAPTATVTRQVRVTVTVPPAAECTVYEAGGSCSAG